jgi:uncharacterized protein
MTLARSLLKAPILLYQWTLRPFLGWTCRHQPTCSAYALEAINTNGAWRGFWLMVARLARCQPWGSHGYDPVPDVSKKRYPLYAAYRYGTWTLKP